MTGAIFYASRYGSTAQYARWIADAAGLPLFDLNRDNADPDDFDFVVLGAPVIYHKLMGRKWARRNLASLLNRPVILFSVSGAGAGPKLDAWMQNSLPATLIAHAEHFALRGRQYPKDLTRFDRLMLIVGGLMNRDPIARREEIKGFDYMDKTSIAPIVDRIHRLRNAPPLPGLKNRPQGSPSPADGQT